MNLPPFNVFPELISDKLVLRQVLNDDVQYLLDILTYDGKRSETSEEGMKIINKVNQDYSNGDSVNWLIVDRGTSQLLGLIGYYRGFTNGAGEIGCILKEEFRGKGYMSESLQLVTEFGLNRMNLKEVTAVTTRDNKSAIALLNKNGFKQIEEMDDKYLKFCYFL